MVLEFGAKKTIAAYHCNQFNKQTYNRRPQNPIEEKTSMLYSATSCAKNPLDFVIIFLYRFFRILKNNWASYLTKIACEMFTEAFNLFAQKSFPCNNQSGSFVSVVLRCFYSSFYSCLCKGCPFNTRVILEHIKLSRRKHGEFHVVFHVRFRFVCLFCKRFSSEFTFIKNSEVCHENRKQIPLRLNNRAFLVYDIQKFGNVKKNESITKSFVTTLIKLFMFLSGLLRYIKTL